MSPIRFRLYTALLAMFAIVVSAQTDFSVTPDIVSVPVGQETTFTTLLNVDSQPFSAPVIATVTSGPNAGTTVADNGNGIFSYTGSIVGTDTVEFTASVLDTPVSTTATVTWLHIQCSVQPNPAAERIGNFVQLTATILRDGAAAEGVAINYSVTAGPNQGTSGNSTASPSGQALVGYTSNGGVGTDTLSISGSIDGVPFSCPATVNWLDLECSADTDGFAIVGSEYTHTVSIYRDGDPVVGTTVDFFIGENQTATASAPTDAAGDARFSYTKGSGGIDTITAVAIVDGVSTICSTDVEWSHFGCAALPTNAARQINTPHTITLKAIAEGSPVVGATVVITRFGANGVLPANTNTVTDDNGLATFTYTGTSIGEDIVTFAVDGEFCDALVTWRDLQVSVAPTLATVQAGGTHSLVATVTLNGQPAVGASVDLLVDSGPNATAANSAITNAAGIATVGYGSNGTPGRDEIQVQSLYASVGNGASAAVEWKVGACSITPSNTIAALDSSHSVDIDVTLGGVLQAGVSVDVLITGGPNAGDSATLTTDENGRAQFTYTGDGGPGIDTIEANSNLSGLITTCETTVEWISVECSVASDLHAPLNEVASISVALRRNGMPAVSIPVNIVAVSGPNVSAAPIDLNTDVSGVVTATFVDSAGVIGSDLLQISGSIDGVAFSCQVTVHWDTVGAINLLPSVLRPTLGSTIAIPIRVLDEGRPAETTATFEIVAGTNSGTSVPIPTEGNGIAVWALTSEGLGQSDIRAGGTHKGLPFSIAGHVEWIPGPSGGFDPLFASLGSGTHSTTLRLEENGEPAIGVVLAVGVIAGPNTGTGEQLTTDEQGEVTFTYTGSTAGVDTIIATTNTERGTASWNALVEWTAIDCNLSAPIYAQVGSPIDIDLTLAREGIPADAIDVSFDVFGPNNGNNGQVTTTNGAATYSYPGGGTTGIDTITASGTILGAPFSCDVQVEWIDVQCALTPASKIQLVDESVALSLGVTRNGTPVPGLTVTIENADDPGPARATIQRTTDEGGFFDFSVFSDVPEQRTVTVSGSVDGIDFSCSANIEWITLSCNIAVSASPIVIGNPVTLTLDVLRNGVSVTPTDPEWQIISGPNAGLSSTGTPTFTYTGNAIEGDSIEALAVVDGILVECSTSVDWRDVSCSITSNPGSELQIGHTHSASVTVLEEGAPVIGTPVHFVITDGPNAGFSDTIQTNGAGQASFTYTGNTIGIDDFTASGEVSGAAFSCSDSVEWAEYACTLTPANQQVPSNATASFTYQLTRNGVPHPGATVFYEVYNGINAIELAREEGGIFGSFTTGENGEGIISYDNLAGGGGFDSLSTDFLISGAFISCSADVEWVDYNCNLLPNQVTLTTGTEHVLTSFVAENDLPIPGVSVTFTVISGPNVGTTGTATTGPDGIAIFSYTGSTAGLDIIECSGTANQVPFACSTTATWELGSSCVLSPSVGFADIAGDHTLSFNLNTAGTPIEGAPITITVIDGPNFGATVTANTDASGNVPFTWAGSELGTDTILASGPGASCSAAVTWISLACSISLDPDLFGVGSDSLITSNITRNGSPAAGASATLTVLAGPNAGHSETLLADTNGDIFFSYTGSTSFGTDNFEISGTIDGVPFSCSDSIEWIDVACTVAPDDSFQQIGQNQSFTVTLTKNGVPVPGHEVTARRIPGNTNLGSHTTDENGNAAVSISNNTVDFDNVYFNATVDGVSTECFGNVNWIDVDCEISAPSSAQVGGDFDGVLLVSKNGSPFFDADVTWSILSGPNASTATVTTTTDGAGQSTYSYSSNGNSGTDIIQAAGTVHGVPYVCTHPIEWIDVQCSLSALAPTMRLGVAQNIGITVTRNGVTVPGVAADFLVETGPHSGIGTNQIENLNYAGELIGTDHVVANGQLEGVDFSCDIDVSWITLDASSSQPNAKAQINNDFPITVTVLKNGVPAAGVSIVRGGQISRVGNFTDDNGQITFTVNEPNAGVENYSFVGAVDGVDFSTSTQVEWVDLQCSLDPLAEFYQVGGDATVNLTLTLDGQEIANPNANFTVITGPNLGQVSSGNSITYTSNGTPGTDTIHATGTHDGVDFTCVSTIEWADVQCSLSPSNAIADADGSPHSVEFTLTVNGTPAVGETANIDVVTGINGGIADSATTAAGGKITFAIPNGSGSFGSDSFEVSGDIEGISFSCFGSVQWLRTDCSVSPEDAQVVLGQNHSVTVTVLRDGAPAGAGVSVDFSGATTQQISTDAAGEATVTWSGSGSETLIASGNIDGVPFSCSSSVEWVPNAECAFVESAITAGIDDDVLLSIAISQDGNSLPGHPVTFTVIRGPHAGVTGNSNSGEDAFADFLLNGDGSIGTDVIEATSSYLGAPFSCQATVEWIDVQCSLVGSIRAIGGTADLVLSVTRNGVPVSVAESSEVISGPNVNATGLDYTSNGTAGTDTVQATGSVDGVPFSCEAQMQWIDYGCEIQPESVIAEASSSKTFTVTFLRDGVAALGETVTWHDDSTDTTDANGQASITLQGNGTTGTKFLSATAELDGNTVTCQASLEWITASCTLESLASPLEVGANANLVGTLLGSGLPAVGVTVDFEILSGPNAGVVGTGTTGEDGSVGFGYSSNGNFGTDIVEMRATLDGVSTSCQASIEWVEIGCDVSPESIEKQVGANTSLTATITRNGQPAAGIAISASTGDSGVTDGAGKFSVQVSQSSTGTQTVTFNATVDGIATSCQSQVEWVNVTCELTPATADLAVGDSSFANTATLLRNGIPVEGSSIFFGVTDGPNADASLSTTTDDQGQAVFSYLGDSGPGQDTIEIGGDVNGVPFNCSVTRTYRSIPSCSLSPDISSIQTGGSHSITVSVTQDGAPFVGDVSFTVSDGPNAGQTLSTTTDVSGEATFGYTSSGVAGTDTIELSGSYAGQSFSCSTTHEWFDVFDCQVSSISVVGQIDSSVQIIVTVNRNGSPAAGIQVNGQTTDESGEASFNFSQATIGTETVDFIGEGFSCSASIEWVDLQLVLTPQNQLHAVGDTATLDASITRNGAAVTGETVQISIDGGPNTGHTDSGAAPQSFSYVGNDGNGTDQVTATATVEGIQLQANAQSGWLTVDCQLAPPHPQAALGTEIQVEGQVILNGGPAVARDVSFLITQGPHASLTGTGATNNDGIANFAISGSALGVDSIEMSGDINGVPFTCTTTVEWVHVPTCTLSPEDAVVGANESHSITVSYLADSAVAATVINGPNAGETAQLQTDGSGNATFTYTGNGEFGIDEVEFSADFLGAPVTCTTTVNWQTINCQLTGGDAIAGHQVGVVLTLLRNGSEPIPSAVANFAIPEGPNNSETATLQTDGAGQVSFLYLGQGGIGQDRVTVMGSVDGINFECETTVEWLSGIGCTFSPDHASATSCDTQTIRLTALNDGDPVAGAVINIDIGDGPNTGFATTLTTGPQGRASFDLVGTGAIGTDVITATVLVNNVEESCQATREWTNSPPVIHCPADITCNSINPAGGTVWFDVQANDDCDVEPSITCTPPSGSQFPIGTTTVTCIATDSLGAESTCSFNVTITDTIPDELLEGLSQITPTGPVRADSLLLVDMARAPYETVEMQVDLGSRSGPQDFFMGKSSLTVGQFIELGNWLFNRRASIPHLRFTPQGDIYYGPDVLLFSLADNNTVADDEGRVLFDYGLLFGADGYHLRAENIRVRLFGDATLPQNGGAPVLNPSGTDCDEMLAVANFPILGVSWYGSAYLANSYSRFAKGLDQCDLAYAIGLTPQEFRPNHLSVDDWIDGFDSAEKQEWADRFPYAYRLPTYDEYIQAANEQSNGGFATSNGGNFFNSDDFFDNGPTPVGYYRPLDSAPINDLSGNVWEWLSEPDLGGRVTQMGITGGSWYNSQSFGQIGQFFGAEAGAGFADVGVRFVATHDFRFRAYLRETSEGNFGPPEQLSGHSFYPNLQPATDYVWEAEFTHSGLEEALGWIAEPNIFRAEEGFSTTPQEPANMNLTANHGWNLMSVTIEPYLCHSKHLFGMDSTVWAWNPALQVYEYEPGAIIEPFKGYWVHFPSTPPSQIHGFEPLSTQIHLSRFWNLIGPAQDSFSFDDIPGRVGPVYEYQNSAFQQAEIMNVGLAYFLFVSRASQLELKPPPATD